MTRPVHHPADVGLIALDIDGTLISLSGGLTARVAKWVRQAHRTPGVEVVLATGRSAHSTVLVARQLGLETGWAVCSNGSLTVRLDPAAPGGFEVLDAFTFDAGPALEVIRGLLPGALVAVEDVVGRGFLVSAPFPPGELDGNVRVVPVEEIARQPVTRVILRETDLPPDVVTRIVKQTHLPDVTYAIGWTGWIDLNPPGVSKASALEKLRLRLGVPASGTVALGDGSNDISMLRWASRGVAMGDARLEVQTAASEVAPTCDDDGAATVLKSVLAALGTPGASATT
jgi:hydroxymethylpyrimidine pyrophosphatase-like HAD family hydrolase